MALIITVAEKWGIFPITHVSTPLLVAESKWHKF